jgi:hypothetical protein
MEQHHFHTSIAFIPHNFRRSSTAVARSVLENSGRFSLCFHGNDHTAAEFASTDLVLLNTMLQVAERRMSIHRRLTGLDCGRVMVFPQGKFSTDAMAILREHNFDAAINTSPYPVQQAVPLSLAESAQPAVLRYGGFPLFLRADSAHTQCPDIAFKLFFGTPVFIVGHHDTFQRPEALIAAVSRINAAAHQNQIRWTSPASAVSNSLLWRRSADGTYNVRAFSRTIQLSNDSASSERFRIEWTGDGGGTLVHQLLCDGTPFTGVEPANTGTAVMLEMPAGSCHTFALVHRNTPSTLPGLGIRRTVKGFLRRRLSEVRDNHLSRNPAVLKASVSLQRRLLR